MMEQLRETALVGTEKKPLDVAGLPEAIVQHLPNTDPETQFLQANTLLNFYKLAGQYPEEYRSTVEDIIIGEEKPLAPVALLELYPLFALVDHQLRDSVLRLWLDTLIRGGGIVNPEILVNLLRDGQNAPLATRAMITRVIGNKGAWVIRNDPALAYPVQQVGLQAWTDGTTAERKTLFMNLHSHDPHAAIELLQSTWSTESVVTKKVFLELLAQDLTATDIPFVGACYREFAHQPKEKKTERECRRLLAGMLLSTSASSLYKSTTEELNKYFSNRKVILGFVTGRESVSFQLPESEDDFWNVRQMDEAFGLDGKGFDIAVFTTPQLYWLSYLLEALPMPYWASHFDGAYNRCVEHFLTNAAFTTIVSGAIVSIYQGALIAHAQGHRDHALAYVLVNRWNATGKTALLPVLEPKDFERFVANNNYWDDIEVLGNGPFDGEHSWSVAFSERVMNHAFDQAMLNKSTAGLGRVIAQFAHPDSLDALYRFNEKARPSTMYNVWSTGTFQIAHTPIEIRNKIKATTR